MIATVTPMIAMMTTRTKIDDTRRVYERAGIPRGQGATASPPIAAAYAHHVGYAREDIDRVRERTDLAELAAEGTKVKRSGRSVMAVCPFHQEKTPSLSIDPARGLYHCFGCGKSGDVFRWVEETQGLDFAGAVELLARRSGITLTQDPDAARRKDRREILVGVVEAAVDFYYDRLKTGADAGSARGYVRSRGYDSDVVDRFGIGYSPPEWDALVVHLRDRGIGEEAMIKAGLASRSRKGGLIDRFRGRLMFPIYDLRGDAVGFGARLLEGEGPKYLNSPETAIYHKSRLLYGLNWAKSAIVRSDRSVVVEGYTDVIALHLAELPVAVATCGTALGEDHLDLLRRFSERVVLAFDADEAGAGAAIRGFDKSVPGDLDLRVAVLPEGRDPADLVAGGDKALLTKTIEESAPLLQFRVERELERYDLAEPEARGRAVRATAAIIRLHPDPVVRHEYAVLISRRTGVDVDVVERAIGRAAGGRGDPGPAEVTEPERPLTGEEKAEQEVLRLLLANDPAIRRMEVGPELFSRPEHRAAFEVIGPAVEALEVAETPDLGAIIGSSGGDAPELLRRLAMDDRPLPDSGEIMNRVRLGSAERRVAALRAELQLIDPDADPQGYSETFNQLIALERERRDLRSPD
jgi:DNA primase